MPAPAAPPPSPALRRSIPGPAPLRAVRADRAGMEERRRAAAEYMAAVEREMEAALDWIAMTTPEERRS